MPNLLWVGLLIGVPVGAFAPGWVKPIVFVVALVLSDLVHTISHNGQNAHFGQNVHFAVSPALIGAIGVGFGLWAWHYARKRGLGHLGQAELNNRWNNTRGISRWGW
jgi:hypothetical protein